MTGFVYAIAADNGLVKVGYSIDPKKRLGQLQTATSAHCRLLGFVSGTMGQERELHALLSQYKVKREWFYRSKPVLAFVAMVEGRGITPRRQDGHPLQRYRKALQISLQSLADRVGSTKATLSRLECGKQNPSSALAARIKLATNGAVTMDDLVQYTSNMEQ